VLLNNYYWKLGKRIIKMAEVKDNRSARAYCNLPETNAARCEVTKRIQKIISRQTKQQSKKKKNNQERLK
jgi:hypothetical protein